MVKIDYTRDNLLTEYAKVILKERYMISGEESPQDAFARAAKAFADDEDHAQRIYDYASKLWFMFATPVLSNGGTKRGLPISCFLSEVEDSRGGIGDHWVENIWLASMGGGIGTNWSRLRSDGVATSQGSRSTGMIPFMHTVDSEILAINQGDTRRGGYASYLDISHPEIMEFINMRKTTGGDPNRKNLNLHHGVNIPDSFMQIIEKCMEDPDADDSWELIDPHTKTVVETISALKLWELILETRIEWGEPYIHFIDTSNRLRPKAYKEADLKITQSNLCCVTPDTLILTKEFGQDYIQNFEGQEVDIWNGKEWSKVNVVKTGENQKVIKIKLSGYQEIECTPYHKFYIQRGYTGRGKVECIEAKDLKPGDKLEKWDMPKPLNSISPIDPAVDAYSQGFYSGDGNKDREVSWLYNTKYCCQKRLVGEFGEEHNSAKRKSWRHGSIMLDKAFVPIYYSVGYKINWLAGLYDADGTVINNNNSYGLQLASINLDFLKEVRSLYLSLGVSCKISRNKKASNKLMPDGRGGEREYHCKEIYRILLSSKELQKLLDLGIKFERLEVPSEVTNNRSALHFIKVEEVIDEGKVSDTYCFKEHKRSRGMFNGIVTGNSEILIPTDPDTTAVCCLSSVNLEKYDEWKDTDMVRDLIRMLDNILDYFIDNAPEQMHKAVKGATRGRDIGLGAMGFHAYLQSKGIPFESAMASSRNRVMFKDIYDKAKEASQELAQERGMAPVVESCSYSIPAQRNVQLMSIAPNASSSIICGGTSPSVEPFSANMYTEKTQNGSNTKRNKFLTLTEDQWKEVSSNQGSVQSLDTLDKDTKDVFKTAFEIDQHWIIDHAASRQPYICQSQSINLFFNANTDISYLHSVHFSAWKKGLKTLYYCRSRVTDRADDINQKFDRHQYGSECLSCEG